MFSKIASFSIAAAAALSVAALQSPAGVYFPDDTSRIGVRSDDLDLKTPAGAQAMRERIAAAARAACGPQPADQLSFGRYWNACVRETANRALVDLGAARVGRPG